MSINKQTDLGKINITNKAVATIVADAAMECYGIVGICSKELNSKILKRENLAKGIAVRENKSGYEISFSIIVALGVKVTEVLRSVQKKVKYVLESTLDIKVRKVNVYVQNLKKVE